MDRERERLCVLVILWRGAWLAVFIRVIFCTAPRRTVAFSSVPKERRAKNHDSGLWLRSIKPHKTTIKVCNSCIWLCIPCPPVTKKKHQREDGED